VNQLQEADRLVMDATGLVGGRNATPLDHMRAQMEMLEASQIRQSVANRLKEQIPDNGGLGGEYLSGLITSADAQEQQAFQLVQSSNPQDISEGASELKAANEQLQQVENSWLSM
jgi:hypothetical protein